MTISYTGCVACWPEQMLRFCSPKGNIPQKQTCRADIMSARCKNSQDHWIKHKTGQWKVGSQNWMENRWYRKKWHPHSSISVNTINSMSIWEEGSGSQLWQFLLYNINVKKSLWSKQKSLWECIFLGYVKLMWTSLSAVLYHLQNGSIFGCISVQIMNYSYFMLIKARSEWRNFLADSTVNPSNVMWVQAQ